MEEQEYLKYSGRSLVRYHGEYRIGAYGNLNQSNKIFLHASTLGAFNFEDAIKLMAREKLDSLDPQARAQTNIFELERQLRERYAKQIATFQEIRRDMGSYEKELEDITKIMRCRMEIEGTPMYDDPKLKKMLTAAIGIHERENRKLEERIKNDSKKVAGLPLVSGLGETRIIDEQTGKSEKAYTRFEMREGTIDIDAKQFSELCIDTMRTQDSLAIGKRTETEYEKRIEIAGYAAKNNIGEEEAEKQLAAKERKSELGVKYSITMRDIDTISKVLNMPIPENIKARFKEGEIEKYEQVRAKSTKALAEYGELIQEISDLELNISKAKRFEEELESLSIPAKQKEKLEKRIKKLISKAEKRKAKCEAAKEKSEKRKVIK